MLYCDAVAKTEEEAINIALKKMRLDKKDSIVRSVVEVPEGVKVRVEAARSRGQEVIELLKFFFENLGVKTELFYIESYDKILINVTGPYLGLIIGKGGSTLEALETIVSAIHNRDHVGFKPVVINPGGYRENKRKALKSLVKRACETVAGDAKVSLPIMKQRDRKQVHQIIKDFPGFRSRSFGDGIDRRVYIYKVSDEDDGEVNPEAEIDDFIAGNQIPLAADDFSPAQLTP